MAKKKPKNEEKKRLEFRMMNPADLKDWSRNPRDNDEAAEVLADAIREHGFIDPIVVDENLTIRAGHTRKRAALALGLKEVPCVIVHFPDEAHAAAYALSDNRTAEVAKWVEKDLAVLLEELKSDPGIKDITASTAFTGDEVERLLHKIHESETGETLEDGFEPDPLESIETDIVPGDIIALGEHRLICGDGTDLATVERLLDGEQAGMVFTDPPYNVDYGHSKNPRHKLRKIEGDKQTPEQWLMFCGRIADIVKRFCKGDFYCWGASGPDGMKQRLRFIEDGIHWSATIVWRKQQLILTHAKYQRIYEPCFYGWPKKSSFDGGRQQVEVWEVDWPHDSKEHPTMKPVRLAGKAIRNSSIIGAIVLDNFAGSGPVVIACQQLRRRAYLVELDPRYCQIICTRWEQYTGEKVEIIRRLE